MLNEQLPVAVKPIQCECSELVDGLPHVRGFGNSSGINTIGSWSPVNGSWNTAFEPYPALVQDQQYFNQNFFKKLCNRTPDQSIAFSDSFKQCTESGQSFEECRDQFYSSMQTGDYFESDQLKEYIQCTHEGTMDHYDCVNSYRECIDNGGGSECATNFSSCESSISSCESIINTYYTNPDNNCSTGCSYSDGSDCEQIRQYNDCLRNNVVLESDCDFAIYNSRCKQANIQTNIDDSTADCSGLGNAKYVLSKYDFLKSRTGCAGAWNEESKTTVFGNCYVDKIDCLEVCDSELADCSADCQSNFDTCVAGCAGDPSCISACSVAFDDCAEDCNQAKSLCDTECVSIESDCLDSAILEYWPQYKGAILNLAECSMDALCCSNDYMLRNEVAKANWIIATTPRPYNSCLKSPDSCSNISDNEVCKYDNEVFYVDMQNADISFFEEIRDIYTEYLTENRMEGFSEYVQKRSDCIIDNWTYRDCIRLNERNNTYYNEGYNFETLDCIAEMADTINDCIISIECDLNDLDESTLCRYKNKKLEDRYDLFSTNTRQQLESCIAGGDCGSPSQGCNDEVQSIGECEEGRIDCYTGCYYNLIECTDLCEGDPECIEICETQYAECNIICDEIQCCPSVESDCYHCWEDYIEYSSNWCSDICLRIEDSEAQQSCIDNCGTGCIDGYSPIIHYEDCEIGCNDSILNKLITIKSISEYDSDILSIIYFNWNNFGIPVGDWFVPTAPK